MKTILYFYYSWKIRKIVTAHKEPIKAVIALRNWAKNKEISGMEKCGLITQKDYYFNDFNLNRNFLQLDWSKRKVLSILNPNSSK